MISYPSITMTSQLKDAHLYIFKKWVIDYIVISKDLFNIRRGLLPLLLHCQRSKNKRQKEGLDKLLTSQQDMYLEARAWSKQMESDMVADNDLFCAMYLWKEDGFCMRATSIFNYCEMNRQMAKNPKISRPSTAEISNKTQVRPFSIYQLDGCGFFNWRRK
jgi:translation initiation factor eIF-2B subunit gamma